MDNETKQIFEQLIEAINNNRVDSSQLVEAVDKLNSPDWWTIGITSAITVVNAAIMVWLGWKQYKLQQQQFRTQEYEILKRLYILVSNANRLIDNFIEDLDMSLWEPCYNSNKDALSQKKTHIDNLFKDLRESYTDYELKLSKDSFNKDGYLTIFDLMSRLLQHTIESLEKGEAHLSQGHQTVHSVSGDMEEGHIRHICLHFKGRRMQNLLYMNLRRFVELKKSVRCDDSLLERIRAKCKID